MNKLQLLTKGLEDAEAFDSSGNKTAKQMADMLGDSVPFTMSLAIANYTMSTFVGHFHYKIELARDNLIPMNVIIFVLAKSGAKKTSSMLKLEKALKRGYDVIQDYRLEKERQWAEENDTEPRQINPLSNALATEAGMVKRLNDFKKEGIGCPALYVDEISTELASNPDMIPNIKLVAQLFDVGDMKSKPLKDSKMQSDEVHGMGMTALFIGSEHGIMEEIPVRTKFETEFISKLARRSYFVYPEFKEEEEEVTTLEELLKKEKQAKDSGYELNQILNKKARKVAHNSIGNDFNNMTLSEDCSTLYTIYSLYCEEVAKLDDSVEAVALEQQHRHWKALKLAGVYAVFNEHQQVEVQDLKEAIYVAELTGKDIGTFVEKANREPYEIMLEHFKDGGPPVSVHDMVKKKWITKPSDLKNIMLLANAKSGRDGMIEQTEDGLVAYSSFSREDGLGVSYLMTDSVEELIRQGMGSTEAKNKIASKTATGYKYKKTTFEKIGNLMRTDTVYAPFQFRNGVRGRDHLIGGASFIVLDIDDTDITDTECSDMLADYKHIIARGSNPDNPYKYRVLLPLDVTVEIENDKWKPFIKKVGEHLGLNVDLLPMSQIYFGYKGRTLIINSDGEELEASELVKNIDAVSPRTKPVKKHQLEDVWNERLDYFSNAYNARSGRGLHNNLWYATAKAHDLGFSLVEGYQLLDDILDYIEDIPRKGFVNTLKRRMSRDKSTYQHWVEEAQNA